MSATQTSDQSENDLSYDVVIVGGGPAGLGAAIRLRQLCVQNSQDLRICVLEKGSEIGAHILSGALFDPKALNELIPEWKEKGAPLKTSVTSEKMAFLTKRKRFFLPIPRSMNNHGNYIISLGNLCRWLAQEAEQLGVDIFPGFPAASLLKNAKGAVIGVRTSDQGRERSGAEGDAFQSGVNIYARHTLLGEGCRGSLSQRLIKEFDLAKENAPQTYGLGIKELWEIDPTKHQPGHVMHTVGWPLDNRTYGGSFLYHLENNQVSIGFVVGLDYENPYLNPYQEFQKFKTHPNIRKILEGGKRISYGARALNEGGLQALPKLVAPGVSLLGCSAGFLNVMRLKGSHLAMKSGMLAADALYDHLCGDKPYDYEERIRGSWIYQELHRARNIRPGFSTGNLKGLWAGLMKAGIDQYIFNGHAPWTFHQNKADHENLKPIDKYTPIEYPKPDGVLTFDLMASVYLSGTGHREDQPCHLALKDPHVPETINRPQFGGPESRYCPAGVYEYIEKDGKEALQINAQNCLHCKTCDIKDPTQNITWITPEGSGGPKYPNM